MLLNYCGKEENKVSLEQMREEVLAMLKVCFEGVSSLTVIALKFN